jgi:hypothetical protein
MPFLGGIRLRFAPAVGTAAGLPAIVLAYEPNVSSATEFYAEQAAPILVTRCIDCHSEGAAERGLRLGEAH